MDTAEHFLVCTNDYHVTSVGLFRACTEKTLDLLGSYECDNKLASKKIFLFIDELLKKNNLTLEDCSFFAANQGPSPFTTLRTVIASINGLAFATKKPLVGVNGIEAFVQEQHDDTYDYVIALNNAFGNDVYYATLNTRTHACVSGCMPYDAVVEMIHNLPKAKIKIIGGIAQEKRTELEKMSNHTLCIDESVPDGASIEEIGKQAYHQWRNKHNIVTQLTPLYLKQYTVKS